MNDSSSLQLLFEAGRQLLKVRLMTLFSVVCAAGAVWGGVVIAESYGTRPADGGVIAPLGIRLAFGGCVALMGVAFAFGMWIYGKCYIARIEYDRSLDKYLICTSGLIVGKCRWVDRSDVAESRSHEGKLDLQTQVDAPWTTLWIKGRRLPFILDDQGKFHKKSLVTRLFR